MKERVLLVGGGGHCKSCIDVIDSQMKFEIAGIVDDESKLNEKVGSYQVIASDESVKSVCLPKDQILITVGHINQKNIRIILYDKYSSMGFYFATVISPHAYVARNTVIGRGTIIMHHALVNTDAQVGNNCILNTGCVIEHDVNIGDHCHVSTGAYLNGGVAISSNVLVGSKAVLIQDIKVCSDVVIGAGSVVVKDILESGIYVGNPARRIA